MSRTSTSRRCAFITTSTTRRTSTRPTPRSRAPSSTSKSIEEILKNLDALPADKQKAVRNNGGGHYNHSLFWEFLSPDGGGEPDGELAEAINGAFGSFDEFKAKFKDAGVNQFGSGWAWLVHDGSGLAVTSTPNQDSPALGRPDAAAGRRRVGARVLPEVPEQAPGLPGRVLERRQLEQGRRAVRRSGLITRSPQLPSGRGVGMSLMTETSRRRARRFLAVAAVCAAALPTAPALAAPDQQSLIEDETLMLESGPGGPGPGARRGEGARRRRDPRERDLVALRAVPDLQEEAEGLRRQEPGRLSRRASSAMLDSFVAGAQARGLRGAADADRADPGVGLALQGLGRDARTCKPDPQALRRVRPCTRHALSDRQEVVDLERAEPALVAEPAVRGHRARRPSSARPTCTAARRRRRSPACARPATAPTRSGSARPPRSATTRPAAAPSARCACRRSARARSSRPRPRRSCAASSASTPRARS